MSSLTLLGQAAPWFSTWLTPVWFLGLGAVIGLGAILALWAIVWVLSRVPAISQLSENPVSRNLVVGVGGVVLLAAYLWVGTSYLFSLPNVGANAWISLFMLSWICFLVPYALVTWVNRRVANELPITVTEGPLRPIGIVAVLLSACSLLGFFVVRNPGDFLHSLNRLPYSGTSVTTIDIPAAPNQAGKPDTDPPLQPIAVSFQRDELRSLAFDSSENVEVLLRGPTEDDPLGRFGRVEVNAESKVGWIPLAQNVKQVFPESNVTQLWARNLSSNPATLQVSITTAAPIPQVSTVPFTAVAVFLILLAYVLQSTLMPRVSAISLATFKSEVAQPLFPLIAIIGVFLLLMFVVIPYNTFGEDIKMLKDAGVKLILVLTIIQAVWAASTSIAEEVDGRTALTVLSKPVSRHSFIIGKFLGIAWTVALMFVIFSVIFLVIVAYKPIYDEREGGFDIKEYGQLGFGSEGPNWQICHLEMASVAPGLVLAFMETIVLAAISVAISTRLPMLANFVICFTIYVLGNLTPMIVKSSVGQFEIVQFVGQLIATIVPNLESFDIQAAMASGQMVPIVYIGGAFVYCLIYTLIAMLLALFLFEDRDMA